MIDDGFYGLRFAQGGPFNDDLGRLMAAVLRHQMRREPRMFLRFFAGTVKQ